LISSSRVGASGKLTSLNSKTADIKVGGADLTIGGNGRFLYAHNTLAGTISGFRIMSDGGLKLVTTARGLPTNGLGGGVGSGLMARDG
jgi:6-phosphogluconolactonase (cycloisomerase 2 family)